MKAINYYEILELRPTASTDDVKRAFRRLARKYHPDAGTNAASDKAFSDIREAYEVLGDPEARRVYDRKNALTADHRNHLDKSRRQADRTTGRPAAYNAGVNLRSQVTLTRPSGRATAAGQTGPRPAGYGTTLNDAEEPSKGSLLQKIKEGVRMAFDRGSETPRRAGATTLRGERVYRFTIDALESLQGTTREVALENANAVRTVKVKIPPGVHDGDTLSISCPQTGTFPAENIKVTVQIEPHPLLEREGLDLTVKLPITLGETIKGAELKVPTINASLKVKIPPGWPETKRLRVKGKGLVHPSGKFQGDLYVKVYVVAPASSTVEAMHLANAIDQLYTCNVRQDIPASLSLSKN